MRPNTAIAPYKASATADPNPHINPARLPSLRVFLMQSNPTGPTGAAIEKPSMRLLKKSKSMDEVRFISLQGPTANVVFRLSYMRE